MTRRPFANFLVPHFSPVTLPPPGIPFLQSLWGEEDDHRIHGKKENKMTIERHLFHVHLKGKPKEAYWVPSPRGSQGWHHIVQCPTAGAVLPPCRHHWGHNWGCPGSPTWPQSRNWVNRSAHMHTCAHSHTGIKWIEFCSKCPHPHAHTHTHINLLLICWLISLAWNSS